MEHVILIHLLVLAACLRFGGAQRPKTQDSVPGTKYLGCFADKAGDQLLVDTLAEGVDMSPEICLCKAQQARGGPYQYFGVMWGHSCFASPMSETNTVTRHGLSYDCSTPCSNPEFKDFSCGGPSSLNIYNITSKPSEPFYLEDRTYAAPTQQGMCVHPFGGSSEPPPNTEVVLHTGCNSFTKQAFQMLDNGALQHINSCQCLHAFGGNFSLGTELVLFPGCDTTHNFNVPIGFQWKGDALQHVTTQLCVGSESRPKPPEENTRLILTDACDQKWRKLEAAAAPRGPSTASPTPSPSLSPSPSPSPPAPSPAPTNQGESPGQAAWKTIVSVVVPTISGLAGIATISYTGWTCWKKRQNRSKDASSV